MGGVAALAHLPLLRRHVQGLHAQGGRLRHHGARLQQRFCHLRAAPLGCRDGEREERGEGGELLCEWDIIFSKIRFAPQIVFGKAAATRAARGA